MPSRKSRKIHEIIAVKIPVKCTTEPILVNREKFSKEPKIDKYFQDIK